MHEPSTIFAGGFRPAALTRRAVLASLAGFALAACSRREGSGAPHDTVTLYTSADAFLAQAIVDAAKAATGLDVRLVGDTEATKTMGLVQRLMAEKDRPIADVWWSSEALGTIGLARLGLLQPWTPAALANEFGGSWPQGLSGHSPAHASDAPASWYGVAQRARVIAFNTRRVTNEAPRSLEALCEARWKGRVGLARPQFGTTRSHIAAHVTLSGEGAVRAWLERFKANQPRIYEGNSAAVAGLAVGEVDVCLTDTDDVWVGQAQAWPVDLVYEGADEQAGGDATKRLPSRGAIVIPNTVAIIAGCPNPSGAQRLADFLVSEEAERLMAQSDSRNVPIRVPLATRMRAIDPRLAMSEGAPVRWDMMEASTEMADRLIAEFFPI
jgi:iron(III) transport system substrate-binding protein